MQLYAVCLLLLLYFLTNKYKYLKSKNINLLIEKGNYLFIEAIIIANFLAFIHTFLQKFCGGIYFDF